MTKVCEDPQILNILYIFKTIISIAVIVSVAILIVFIILDIIKLISSPDVDTKKGLPKIMKRVVAMCMVFLVPSILGVVLNLTGQTLNYGSCLDNANREYISIAYATEAEKLITLAETNKSPDTLYKAGKYVRNVKDETLKNNMQSRLDVVKAYIAAYNAEIDKENQGQMGDPNDLYVGGFTSTGSCQPGGTVAVLTKEPDPSCALNYWSNKIDTSKFIYPKDTKTGKPLGAWPTNYKSIPTQLTNMKTYQSGKLIWPNAPENGVYNYVYEHNGIDIMAPIGTPVYSPVNGTLIFSSWGQTKNKGSDETAYTVEISMNSSIIVDGNATNKVFLTHLSGIIYRCESKSSCNMEVKQGQLIGYVGNAQGDPDVAGYAPHLHMTLYRSGFYDSTGLTTKKIENLYGIKSGTKIGAGK